MHGLFLWAVLAIAFVILLVFFTMGRGKSSSLSSLRAAEGRTEMAFGSLYHALWAESRRARKRKTQPHPPQLIATPQSRLPVASTAEQRDDYDRPCGE